MRCVLFVVTMALACDAVFCNTPQFGIPDTPRCEPCATNGYCIDGVLRCNKGYILSQNTCKVVDRQREARDDMANRAVELVDQYGKLSNSDLQSLLRLEYARFTQIDATTQALQQSLSGRVSVLRAPYQGRGGEDVEYESLTPKVQVFPELPVNERAFLESLLNRLFHPYTVSDLRRLLVERAAKDS